MLFPGDDDDAACLRIDVGVRDAFVVLHASLALGLIEQNVARVDGFRFDFGSREPHLFQRAGVLVHVEHTVGGAGDDAQVLAGVLRYGFEFDDVAHDEAAAGHEHAQGLAQHGLAVVAEIDDAIANGAQTLDIMINVGALKDGNLDLMRAEIGGLAEKAKAKGLLCKVILEVAFLTDEEIATATKICCEYGIDYVKTATGSQALPDAHHVEVIRANLSGHTKIKVSGVPRTFVLAACLSMLEMGVELIGTRSACKIVDMYKAYLEEKAAK